MSEKFRSGDYDSTKCHTKEIKEAKNFQLDLIIIWTGAKK